MPGIVALALDEDRRAHPETEQTSAGAMPERMSVKQAAAAAKRREAKIRMALDVPSRTAPSASPAARG
ncbi:hypothetical protein PED38_15600 [Clavibacter sp. CT19]|uniref:hypothetical protein n=1 Tax=Clavibacter sp. CT19 TaxID=3018990 RepID=UPI0022EAE0D6|nr:hypothetical protein [Clavibacter sp. CT19]MDA3806224.1 hypothetical protein [Clavibacter sp. CT19]